MPHEARKMSSQTVYTNAEFWCELLAMCRGLYALVNAMTHFVSREIDLIENQINYGYRLSNS